MNKSEHTPGPWVANAFHIARTNDSEIIIEQDGGSAPIATCYAIGTLSLDQSSANAKLIAAAPELLQELQRMLSVFGCLSEADYQEINPCAKARVHKARALVAKVTGSKS